MACKLTPLWTTGLKTKSAAFGRELHTDFATFKVSSTQAEPELDSSHCNSKRLPNDLDKQRAGQVERSHSINSSLKLYPLALTGIG